MGSGSSANKKPKQRVQQKAIAAAESKPKPSPSASQPPPPASQPPPPASQPPPPASHPPPQPVPPIPEPMSTPVVKSGASVGAVDSWRKMDYERLLAEMQSKQWWEIIDQLSCGSAPVVKPDKQRRGWKTVRMFVSSTFKDMHSEREYLVKHVFPQLRLWCEERKLRLVECDLRWGVPKDADTREILLTCLSEIDRCYAENELPYFISMLSERYGWIPDLEEVPEDIKTSYKWLSGMSVTAMEIAVGSYWIKNPNACFLFRKPDFTSTITDSKVRAVYDSGSQNEKDALDTLKGKLRELFPEQVTEYDCVSEGMDSSGKRLQLAGLEVFGDTVLKHFKATIDKQYPIDSLGKALSSIEIQKAEHETFMIQRSRILLGRDSIVNEASKYIMTDDKSPKILILAGFPGSGKSALVAHLAKTVSSDPKYQSFYHFVGATSGSTNLNRLLTRFWSELLPEDDPAPTDSDELRRSMGTVMSKVSASLSKSGKERLVILVDALNQMDDEGDVHHLAWLPTELPHNVRMIVSSLEGTCMDSLRGGKRTPREVQVDPLDINTRKQVVEQILGEFNKSLDDGQLETIVTKEDAGRPLYLSICCEELRVFGDFRRLDDKITNIAGDLTGLLTQMLGRISEEYGTDLVIATLCLVECSRFGLLETELLELLGVEPVLATKGKADFSGDRTKLPMVQWALVYLGLRQFLRPTGGSGEGRLDFYHRTISKAVRTIFLTNRDDWLLWHRRLADYFQHCTDRNRKSEELPFHLEKLGDTEGLQQCLVQRDMFEELYAEDTKLELMAYWRGAGDYELAATLNVDALNSYLQTNNITSPTERSQHQTKLAWFLIDIGEYSQAEKLLETVLNDLSRQDPKCLEICQPLCAMVTLFYLQALRVVYSTSPVYKRCSQQGSKYSSQCVNAWRHNHPANISNLDLGRTLVVCGYFARELLSEAKDIFIKEDYKQGLAEVLYMLGEKNQYHDDIGVPEGLFQQSFDLCKAHFGFYHLKTARCVQLWGQLYWNRGSYEKSLGFYQQELDILETVQGNLHPNTVRSREDVAIILEELGRKDEANVLYSQQPKNKEV